MGDDTVGSNTGKMVGWKTGLLVGPSVLRVAKPTWSSVAGWLVGDALGSFVELPVSDSLGTIAGTSVGSDLGLDVGVSIDLTEGAGVGSMEKNVIKRRRTDGRNSSDVIQSSQQSVAPSSPLHCGNAHRGG